MSAEVEIFTKETNQKFEYKQKQLSMNFFMFLLLQLLLATFTQTLLFLTFITLAITITIILIMVSLMKSKDDKSPDMELLVEEENFRANSSYKFNLPVPRLPSKVFCLNFRKILEEDHYFALNT